jgi:hypothetical protein
MRYRKHRRRVRNPINRKTLLIAAVGLGGLFAYFLWKASQASAATPALTPAQAAANAAASLAPSGLTNPTLQPISLSGYRLH